MAIEGSVVFVSFTDNPAIDVLLHIFPFGITVY
jgi:hypothetical protein